MKNKMFNHVAITIQDVSEIENFYINILGLIKRKEISLSKDMAKQIFDISKATKVITVGKSDLNLELFIDKKYSKDNFNHICINVKDRERIVKKAQKNNYPCIIIKRDYVDMVFIKDKSNNLFEIKQN